MRPLPSRRPRNLHAATLFLALALPLLGVVAVAVLIRIRNTDWARHLPLAALDRWLGPPPVRWMRRGPFTVVFSRDRTSGQIHPRLHPGPVTFEPHEVLADSEIYGWQFDAGGGDLNGNGRPNLVMVRYEGGRGGTFQVFELVDRKAVLILEVMGGAGRIEGPDTAGMHHLVIDLEEDLRHERQWVRIPLVAGAEPEPIPPP